MLAGNIQPNGFYEDDPVRVARSILGKVLYRRIVERSWRDNRGD
ncbi:MAG: hypothetical protein ACUVQ0_01390 [Thermoproteota archaeon]